MKCSSFGCLSSSGGYARHSSYCLLCQGSCAGISRGSGDLWSWLGVFLDPEAVLRAPPLCAWSHGWRLAARDIASVAAKLSLARISPLLFASGWPRVTFATPCSSLSSVRYRPLRRPRPPQLIKRRNRRLRMRAIDARCACFVDLVFMSVGRSMPVRPRQFSSA